ncbi:uncharacterized protein EDB91DRAFT_1044592 [Suillus paluster]|uniref:uncharacterized protein n=1 Tax=Suillus paluster TaxID=48578 RepID=UPI001B875C89|nr:uncharacterized protein EDB91DRAFT_1044592 [Suillus paluster]KAG1752542.1 hypothetical protein EDB91DRAFT_1044592 [Suillus paluster]
MPTTLESLPVELIATILGELDLASLVKVSCLSRRLRHVASDSSLNPWRRPILQTLASGNYEQSLYHLSIRSIVPRSNWIDILALAPPGFLLFESSLPNLKASEWEECFRKRFLPGWLKWKKENTWRVSYLKMLYRVWHRAYTSCTTDEAWTKYVVLNRNGSVNELESSSRGFSPMAIFAEMQFQSNLSHLTPTIRVVVTFSDVRVIAIGVLHMRRSSLTDNHNARAFLHPPGIEATDALGVNSRVLHDSPYGHERDGPSGNNNQYSCSIFVSYNKLTHPLPAESHRNYPFYTPGGGDRRWGSLEEQGLQWVGGLMFVEVPCCQGMWKTESEFGASWNHFASFTWQDLLTIAPWMKERVTKVIDGPGLGI